MITAFGNINHLAYVAYMIHILVVMYTFPTLLTDVIAVKVSVTEAIFGKGIVAIITNIIIVAVYMLTAEGAGLTAVVADPVRLGVGTGSVNMHTVSAVIAEAVDRVIIVMLGTLE